MSFHLSPSFLASYIQRPAPWGFGALSWFTYQRTYSRNGERWQQTCQRVIEGMFSILQTRCKDLHVPFDSTLAQGQAQDAYERMFTFKWLPPGRGLWMMGTDFVNEEGSAALNNCGFVSSQDINHGFTSPFTWMFQMLMLGVGVGFDTLGHHHKIPVPPVHRTSVVTFSIPDTRQGWCDALDHYLEQRMQGTRAVFDFSLIRPYGAPIKRFGGTASGPGPLKTMFTHMDAAFARTDVVSSTLIADIANIIGQCVVSGNVRRSAQIALGEPGDAAFAALKSHDKIPSMSEPLPTQGDDFNEDFLSGKRPWMWSSNNSLTIRDGDDIDFRDYQDRIGFNGEPGFFWIDNARNYGRMADGFNPLADPRLMGVNPCVEQGLENYELCCLVETFPAHHADLKDYKETLKVAYLYAKAVTCLPTHDERTNAVMRANARIGCSMSGITQAMTKFGTGKFFKMCDESYQYIQRLDTTYSRWLCAPRSIKTTSVKPSGTVSLLAGASPGCHDDHSPFSIRRVRVAMSNPIWEHARKSGYHVEEDVVSPNTMVISFPVATKGAQRPKASVSMWEQFSRASKLQRFWADNQVSATITFQEHEIDHIPNALEHYADQLKGVSMLALDVSAYAQTPYESITPQEYEAMRSKVDPQQLMNFKDVEHDRTERFCDGDKCQVEGE
jgi:ribonucleoside-triphosphate reductase